MERPSWPVTTPCDSWTQRGKCCGGDGDGFGHRDENSGGGRGEDAAADVDGDEGDDDTADSGDADGYGSCKDNWRKTHQGTRLFWRTKGVRHDPKRGPP